jgi:DNA-directed RNA polymerase subunit RPC12/RpoP
MPLTLQCSCGKKLQVDEKYRGTMAKCPACGNPILVQEASTAVQAEEPARPSHSAPDVTEPEDRPRKSPAIAQRSMTPWLIAGGCGVLALFACIPCGIVGMWLSLSHHLEPDQPAFRDEPVAVVQVEKKKGKPAPVLTPEQVLSRNRLNQIGLGIHKFVDANGALPNHAILDKQFRNPLLSWRVSILPYIGEQELYDQIRGDEPWSSEHNRQFWDKMPNVYQLPGKPKNDQTHYQVFLGDRSAFPRTQRPAPILNMTGDVRMAGITDGPSNTIFVVEAAAPVNWMNPADVGFEMQQKDLLDRVANPWGDNTFNALMGDGAVRRMRRTMMPLTLQALITRDGGDRIADEDWQP